MKKRKRISRIKGLAGVTICTLIIVVAFAVNTISQTLIEYGLIGALVSVVMTDKQEGPFEPIGDFDFGDEVDVGGKVYITNTRLKRWHEMIQVMDTAVDIFNMEKANDDTDMRTPYIIGTLVRENGGRLFSSVLNDEKDIYMDLLVPYNICGKSTCQMLANGHSHFVGGTVENGVDMGSTSFDLLAKDEELYREYYGGTGGHAIGYQQFESIYAQGRMTEVYPIHNDTLEQLEDGRYYDSIADINRPNAFYFPDIMLNLIKLQKNWQSNHTSSCKSEHEASRFVEIFASADFKSLSERNQEAIRYMYSDSSYRRGHVSSSEDKVALALIEMVKNNVVENVDELLKPVAYTYYDSNTFLPINNPAKGKKYIMDNYKELSDFDNLDIAMTALYALNVGRLVYDGVLQAIEDNAQQVIDENSGKTWDGHIGSGKFVYSNSKYYSSELGARIYKQAVAGTARNDGLYSEISWGSIKLNKGNSTMGSGGCGIYTLAMIKSNLTNSDYTPDMARQLLGNNSKYVTGMLMNAGVPYLSTQMDMVATHISKGNTAEMDAMLKSELSKGNMILLIVSNKRNGKVTYPTMDDWYIGDGHFIALRGYDENGYYLLTSWGVLGRDNTWKELDEVMKVQKQWKDIAPAVSDIWIVGLQ